MFVPEYNREKFDGSRLTKGVIIFKSEFESVSLLKYPYWRDDFQKKENAFLSSISCHEKRWTKQQRHALFVQ